MLAPYTRADSEFIPPRVRMLIETGEDAPIPGPNPGQKMRSRPIWGTQKGATALLRHKEDIDGMRRFQAVQTVPLKSSRMVYGAISHRGGRGNRVLKIAALGLAAVALVYAAHTVLRPTARLSYGLMIDAGSTGSRIHTFAFRRDAAGALKLVSEDFFPVKPGLSFYKDDPAAAARSLEPLLERARSSVPAARRDETPVFLRATAGLRLTGKQKSKAILKEIRTYLGKSEFRFDGDSWASILGGNDEGIYSWITVNYLLGKKGGNTVGTLEMGGGSSQVAFVPGGAPEVGKCASEKLVQRYAGEDLALYTKSDLGFGLQKARALALLSFERSGLLSNNPCINTGRKINVKIPFHPVGKSLVMSGDGSFGHCLHQVAGALVQPLLTSCSCEACGYDGKPRPKPIAEYVAFAYYLERTVALGMKTPMTVSQIREKGEEVCAMSVDQVRRRYKTVPNGVAEDLCFDLAYIVTHLEYGHGIAAGSNVLLHVKDKIEEIELGWSLGAMFDEMSKLRAPKSA